MAVYRNRGLARAARKTITREAHGVVLALHADGIPAQHKDWHYDLRRGQLHIYGGLLRFLDTCVEEGKPHLARTAVAWLDWYVTELTEPTRAATLTAVA